jgi:hypothetical protein
MRYFKDEMPSQVSRHLMPHEVAILAVKRHPITLVRYMSELIGATALAAFLTIAIPRPSGTLLLLILLLWLLVAGRFALNFWGWTANYFVVTTQRMLLVTGFTTLHVAMLPLVKVADMRMKQTLLGRILNYGEFGLESVSQDTTFHRIRFMPDPNVLYLELTALIFPDPDDK